MLYILAATILLASLVLIHEAGHFAAAKLLGVAVPTVSLGLGRRLAGFHWRGTDYRLSLLPLGGYVTLAGADPTEPADPDVPAQRSFRGRPVWQRILIIAAGPLANLALPVLLFAALQLPEQSLRVALWGGLEQTGMLCGSMLSQLGELLTGEVSLSRGLGGPIEIIRQASATTAAGVPATAQLLGMLSLSVGLINLLPVPVLDGGQLFFLLAEGLRGRPLSVRLREQAQQAGLVALTLLTLLVFVADVHRLLAG